ncbi:MAG: HAD-IB family phosphatase [Vulcanimicrobiaceae bacterium]
MRLAVFVDYDGTITDGDTLDVLMRSCAGEDAWQRLERELAAGTMSLRDVLSAQARNIRCAFDEADALLAAQTHFDPAFGEFVRACEAAAVPLRILSSGIASLIEHALARQGMAGVPVLANDADPSPDGWVMRYRDDSDNGHDKALEVRAASGAGYRTVYVGDGYSDYEASLAADIRFAKRGRSLERFLRERGAEFVPFDSFAEVRRALF